MKCKYCMEDIIEGAIKCKHCGSNLEDKTEPNLTENINAPKEMRWWQYVFYIVIAFFAIMTISDYYKSNKYQTVLGDLIGKAPQSKDELMLVMNAYGTRLMGTLTNEALNFDSLKKDEQDAIMANIFKQSFEDAGYSFSKSLDLCHKHATNPTTELNSSIYGAFCSNMYSKLLEKNDLKAFAKEQQTKILAIIEH